MPSFRTSNAITAAASASLSAAASKLKLLQPLTLGDLTLSNRMVMAPLTRMRAGPGYVPTSLNAQYYGQRASAGLIVTEATLISSLGRGHPFTPGIYTQEQVEGWREVVKTVHEKGGHIFMQLWHVGRASHSSVHPDDGLPIAPSAIPPPKALVLNADLVRVSPETPRAMTLADIHMVIEQYRAGAANAKTAGFDGVEIHGANGYLLDQFLQDGTNQRTDQYGGSFENRSRLLLQVVDAVSTVFPLHRIGVRLSPFGSFNDMSDSNSEALFSYVISILSKRHIGYLHLIEPRVMGGLEEARPDAPCVLEMLRSKFEGVLITAGGYTRETGEAVLDRGIADAVAFGRSFIANPDLPRRFALNAPLNPYNRATFYTRGPEGYIDYPFLEDSTTVESGDGATAKAVL